MGRAVNNHKKRKRHKLTEGGFVTFALFVVKRFYSKLSNAKEV